MSRKELRAASKAAWEARLSACAERNAKAVADYAIGVPRATIEARYNISKTSLNQAIKKAGVPWRKGTGSYGRAEKPEAEPEEQTPYDRMRVIPESPCECGGGCGLTFRKVMGQRSRKFAKDCPVRAEFIRQQNIRVSAARRKKRREELIAQGYQPRHGGSRSAATDVLPRPKMCLGCFNLAHNRPEMGCPACGLPREELTEKERLYVERVKAECKQDDRHLSQLFDGVMKQTGVRSFRAALRRAG